MKGGGCLDLALLLCCMSVVKLCLYTIITECCVILCSQTDDSKDDYSHLPPNQQKKKLTQKIETLRGAIAKDTAER